MGFLLINKLKVIMFLIKVTQIMIPFINLFIHYTTIAYVSGSSYPVF